ncbi:hypothetical protein E5A73_09050 [Sphingomonas gei]|uniref:Uncharacterized protein n=1 Tax=Sphingomonas gei TaxID=1395960 RepID=A0A4S1XE56_9SPHN|nr:hypothetical protein [Sphingomonas gei]TGX54248.1 hypothetical protein E5A73_09050 [Sphingomonas gei]
MTEHPNFDGEPAAPEPSLAHRLAALVKRGPRGNANPPGATRPDAGIAALVAVLIAAGPLLTIGGATLLTARQRIAAARLADEASPRIKAARNAVEARGQIAALLGRPPLGATIEALARVLPPDAALVRAGRTAQGLLEIEVEVPDPDKLRAALRRAPAFARLRNTGQRQADAKMIVTFAGTAP